MTFAVFSFDNIMCILGDLFLENLVEFHAVGCNQLFLQGDALNETVMWLEFVEISPWSRSKRVIDMISASDKWRMCWTRCASSFQVQNDFGLCNI